jgi:hypothetical protein
MRNSLLKHHDAGGAPTLEPAALRIERTHTRKIICTPKRSFAESCNTWLRISRGIRNMLKSTEVIRWA